MPADVISTNSARVRQLVDGRAAAVAHRRAQAAHQLVDHRRQRALVRHAALDAFGHELLRRAPRLRRPGSSGRSCPAASRRASPCRGSSCTSGPGRARSRPATPRCRRTGCPASRTTRRRRSPSRCRRSSGCRRRRSPARRPSPTPSIAHWIAEICGTPTPATMRVVQIEPGTDADLDAVGAVVDQRLRAGGGGDVAADHLHLRDSASSPTRTRSSTPCE